MCVGIAKRISTHPGEWSLHEKRLLEKNICLFEGSFVRILLRQIVGQNTNSYAEGKILIQQQGLFC